MVRPPGPDRPLYARIAAVLKSRVLAGTYPPGSRLPGEDDLAAVMGVSRSTIRQAIADLRRAGYVTSQRGSGTYVAAELPVEPLSPRSGPVYTGFLDDLDNEAHHVRETHRDRRDLVADQRLAADLRVPEGSPVVAFTAVRARHGTVYGVATDVLPAHVAAAITPEVLDRSPTTPDALTNAGHRVVESLQRVEPTLLDAATAARCGVAPGAPALLLTGIAYDQHHTPVDSYTLTIVAGYGIGLHLTRANPIAATHPPTPPPATP
ncbi:GntR family transcriptional regulator [Goodfellowiella coeruleoviolacea]|uniref:GntR family transcriptional regulator n=1 Tax=Goodfellowiella coeruleoviolacea TaxID=334858 RepID=A0AAE3KHK1_9PSEU|nr:GntR family transcriptional regulator [Goodfellowiella coeruleoviolacea]MCP2168366.1 GntR family transcriptional regulator [Goodfellowiella coeruleoviolacea]